MSTNTTAELLDDLAAFIATYVVVPGPEYRDVMALWVAHTHVIGAAWTTPRLVFKSAEKESGKTRALEVLELLVLEGRQTVNTTVAAIFRRLKQWQTTYLVDEVDTIFNPKAAKENEELRGILNAGYRRGATVDRVAMEGKRAVLEEFPVFAATALAAIGDLPDTIESRAIVVPMRRRAPDEQVSQFRYRKVKPLANPIKDRLTDWAAEHEGGLGEAEPDMPDGISDRAAECWEPLLAIADLAGEEWAQRARAAAVSIVGGRVAADQSTGVRLLADVRAVMDGHDRRSTAGLVAALNGLEEAPWGSWHDGKGMTARDLARRLKPYGIESRTVRQPDGSTPKGYVREDFLDAWSRYLRHDANAPCSAPRPPSATSATSATQIRIPVADVAAVADTPATSGVNSATDNAMRQAALCPIDGSSVTVLTGQEGQEVLCPTCRGAGRPNYVRPVYPPFEALTGGS
jgi:Protein of unknown function (DUF3631)